MQKYLISYPKSRMRSTIVLVFLTELRMLKKLSYKNSGCFNFSFRIKIRNFDNQINKVNVFHLYKGKFNVHWQAQLYFIQILIIQINDSFFICYLESVFYGYGYNAGIKIPPMVQKVSLNHWI